MAATLDVCNLVSRCCCSLLGVAAMPTFGAYAFTFFLKFIILFIHAVPYADFRYWQDATGECPEHATRTRDSVALTRCEEGFRDRQAQCPLPAASVHSDSWYSRLHRYPDLFTSPPDLRWWLPGSRRCARAEINYKLALKDNMVLHGGVLVAITYISSP